MSTLFNYEDLHIEISSKCTLKCPRCPRTELDLESLNREITGLEFQQAFPADFLVTVKKILFCGDIGDPIYARDLIPICRYIKETSPETSIKIITNGSYKGVSWWEELGTILLDNDTVTFSVDGWNQESNQMYRVNSDWDSIIKGARALRGSSRCAMAWSSIFFRFNEDHIEKIRAQAKSLGFDSFGVVKSTKFDGRYLVDGRDILKPLNNDHVSSYTVYDKHIVDRLSDKSIPMYISKSKNTHPWAKCLNWQKELFINVDGLVFPCPWFNSGYQYNDFVDKHRERISIKTRTLVDILNDPLWRELMTRFEVMPLDICKIKCKNG